MIDAEHLKQPEVTYAPLELEDCWHVDNFHYNNGWLNTINIGDDMLFEAPRRGAIAKIKDAVGLGQGNFRGHIGFKIAIEHVDSLQAHLPLPDGDLLKALAAELAEEIRNRRLQESEAQVNELTELLALQDQAWVLIRKNIGISGVRHSAAVLKGFFLDSSENEPKPGLLLEGKTGKLGWLPKGSQSGGLYLPTLPR